jgi:predicted Rossmann fold flavoprotein
VVVVGAGAAGLVAAWRSASAGVPTLLLEANPRAGVKIRISGGGKCNVTHAGPVREVLSAFPAAQARFLRPALHAFSNEDLLALLRREGVETYARPDGRVFPNDRPGSSQLVVEALQGLAAGAGVQLVTDARVEGLAREGAKITGLKVNGECLAAARVILATGGASYPRTGTRGEALRWLRDLGLVVKPWFPALAPIPLHRPRPEWEGVALRNGELRYRSREEGPLLGRSRGDILFTRVGITGPAALDLSEQVEGARRAGGTWLEYAFVNAPEPLQQELLAQASSHPEASVRRWLGSWIPDRIAAGMADAWGLEADLRLSRLSRNSRSLILHALAGFPLGAAGTVALELGEVCAGGLALGMVEPRTMAVRNWENLHVCGELLDVNGPVGGYNLQAAFSTGFLAGGFL